MVGFVKGSKAYYMYLKEKLIDISTLLAAFNLSEEEKNDLYVKQVKFMAEQVHLHNGFFHAHRLYHNRFDSYNLELLFFISNIKVVLSEMNCPIPEPFFKAGLVLSDLSLQNRRNLVNQ